MGTKGFVNLAVKDLKRSVDFFTELNYKFDPQSTDGNATCLVIADDIFGDAAGRGLLPALPQKQLTDASTRTPRRSSSSPPRAARQSTS